MGRIFYDEHLLSLYKQWFQLNQQSCRSVEPPLIKRFLSSTVLLIFEHCTQPVTTATEWCYTTVRQDSLTLSLENETNIPEMVCI